MFSYMTHNHSTISIHNHSTLLGLGLENDGKQMISNSLQGKLDRLWMIRGGSTLGLGRIVSGDAGRIDSGADRPVSGSTLNAVAGFDSEPRTEIWSEHFAYQESGGSDSDSDSDLSHIFKLIVSTNENTLKNRNVVL